MTQTAPTPSWPSIWTVLARSAFRQGWIDAGGIRTRYCQAGRADAPAVLLVHGMGASWETFCANVAPLSERFNVIAFDSVGNGFSDKSALRYDFAAYARHIGAVMDSFGLTRASLIGMSVAGNHIGRFALDHPERVSGLVMVGSLVFAPSSEAPSPDMRKMMADASEVRLRAVHDPSWENIAPIMAGLIHAPEKRIPDFVALRQQVHSLPGMVETMQRLTIITELAEFDRQQLGEAGWAKITAPTLATVSEFDSPAVHRNADRLVGCMPDCRKTLLSGVGHWPQWEDPAQFNRVVAEFLIERS